MLEDLFGTRGAYLLDDKLDILGKVPFTELGSTIKSLKTGIHAVIFDGALDKELLQTAEYSRIKFVCAMESKAISNKLSILTLNELA